MDGKSNVWFAIAIILVWLALMWMVLSPTKAHAEPLEWNEERIPTADLIDRDLLIKYEEYRQNQINLLARMIKFEVGNKSSDCKQAVAQTPLNRLRSGKWGDTLEEVLYYPNAYSMADNGEPSAEDYEIAEWVLDHPNVFPSNMYYFREDHYHRFGIPYTHIDGTYFSCEEEATWN